MALAIQVFVLQNSTVRGLRSSLLHGALLGFVVYGVYDFTNRAVLDAYPVAMVVVDIMWGTGLFTAVTYLNYNLRKQLTFM
jgi:uncharacterized membrane protein